MHLYVLVRAFYMFIEFAFVDEIKTLQLVAIQWRFRQYTSTNVMAIARR